MSFRLRGNESGQSMVIIALAMVAIIGMVALVTDGGFAYLERRRVQNAADSAVLAGVRTLATGGDEYAIRQSIDDYAQRNGVVDPARNVKAFFVDSNDNLLPNSNQQVGQNGQVPSNAVGVVLKATKSHATFFAGIFGFDSVLISAVSQAKYSAAARAPRLLPIAVVSQTLVFSDTYVLWASNWLTETTDSLFGDWTEPQAKSHRGWLNFNGGSQSAADLKDWVCNGYNMEYPIPVWVNGGPGVDAAVVAQANSCNMYQTVFIPIYDVWTCKQNVCPGVPEDEPFPYPGNELRDYRVVAFAAFTVVPDPNKKTIAGKFERWVAAEEVSNAVSYGTVTIKLTPPANVP